MPYELDNWVVYQLVIRMWNDEPDGRESHQLAAGISGFWEKRIFIRGRFNAEGGHLPPTGVQNGGISNWGALTSYSDIRVWPSGPITPMILDQMTTFRHFLCHLVQIDNWMVTSCSKIPIFENMVDFRQFCTKKQPVCSIIWQSLKTHCLQQPLMECLKWTQWKIKFQLPRMDDTFLTRKSAYAMKNTGDSFQILNWNSFAVKANRWFVSCTITQLVELDEIDVSLRIILFYIVQVSWLKQC